MSTWSDRAPLSARQLDALRHLEAWASRNEEAPAPPQQLHYSMGPAGALIAHPEPDTPSTVEAVDSMGALESFAMRAEALMQERRHAPDREQLQQLDAQRECAAALEAHCDSMRAQLDGKATECATLRSASSDLLERFGKRVEAHREEQALQAALRQQLAPLEEARAQGLPELCEVVLILRTEVMPEILSGGPPVAPLEKLIHRLLQDTQERITFRVQTFVRDEIRNFKPEDPDIDYPRVRAQPQPAGDGDAAGAGEPATASDSTMMTWYVTVSRALSCLAQLYRCVPRAVFEGLAQEILTECTDSIGRAASRIVSRKRSSLDGTLFTVSQLLTLREQIAPFDSDFAITHKQLDFTQTREAVRSLVERRGRLGGIGGALELLQSGAPLLVQSQHDAKAALDAQLRTACEAFIQHATNAAAKPLTDVLEMPNASFVASASAEEAPSKLDMKVVAAAVEKAEAGVHGELATAHQLMTAYLPEAQTHEILFAPVRTNVLDALGQLETLIHAAGLTAAERVGCETERLTKLSAAVDGMGAASRGHAAHGRDRAT